jgi:hypothetical protein
MEIGILVIGILLIMMALIMTPSNNFKSKFLFSVLPFFSGLYLLVYFAVEIGILNI